MKKMAIVILLAVCLASSLLAQGIRVTHPRAGEELLRDSETTISWLHARGLPSRVRIELHRNNEESPPGNINVSTENDGSFQWNLAYIGNSDGKYFIRVSTLDGSVHGDSGIFAIRTPRPRIRLTWPNGGETIFLNTNQSIRWNPVDILPGTLADIYLLKNGSEPSLLINGCRADVGHTPWPVLDNLEPGADYRVRMRVRGADAGDDSDADFTLAASSAVGDIEPLRLRTGVDGKIYLDIRSTFPSLRRALFYTIKRPSWAPTRTGRFNLNVVFDGPGEKSYSLESVLPTNFSLGGNIFLSYYEVTLDPENIIAETNERNNFKAAGLCGHRVFPVIEKVLFGSQPAQRNQLLEVNNGRIVEKGGMPKELYLQVRVLIRNYGYDVGRGKVKISQIGVQSKPWRRGGGTLPEYQERQVVSNDVTLAAGMPEHLHTYSTLPATMFYLDNTDILVEYVWEGEGARTAWASFRFPVSFDELLREYERTH